MVAMASLCKSLIRQLYLSVDVYVKMLHGMFACLQFPSLCPYNDATYVLRIEEKTYGGAMVYTDGPRVHHWNRGGAKVIRVIRNAGLLYKREYNMTISVQTLVGESFIMFEFGEICDMSKVSESPMISLL